LGSATRVVFVALESCFTRQAITHFYLSASCVTPIFWKASMMQRFLVGDLVIHRLSTVQKFDYSRDLFKNFPIGVGVILEVIGDEYFVMWNGQVHEVTAIYLQYRGRLNDER